MSRLSARTAGLFIVLLTVPILTSCRAGAVYANPGEVADIFYSHQTPGADPMPDSLFLDETSRNRVMAEVNGRILTNGEFQSRKKVGSNLQVHFGGQGREETLTYVFEVDCDMGMTRETLVLKRGRKSDPYKISSYQVEYVEKMRESTPMSSSSA